MFVLASTIVGIGISICYTILLYLIEKMVAILGILHPRLLELDQIRRFADSQPNTGGGDTANEEESRLSVRKGKSSRCSRLSFMMTECVSWKKWTNRRFLRVYFIRVKDVEDYSTWLFRGVEGS